MRTRIRLCLLICCCAALGACAAAPKGPDVTVTTPAVRRPPAPASVAAAMASEVFTPYAGLGAATGDGLAPGDTYAALHTACMSDAGYGQYAGSTPYPAATSQGLGFAEYPFGWFGYLGTAEAAQDGFTAPPSQLPDDQTPGSQGPGPANPLAGLPAGAQAAAGKCFNIVMDFNNTQLATSMAVIMTLNNDIGNDEVQDPNINAAMKAWSACMAKNGYSTSNANTLAHQEQVILGLRPPPGQPAGGPVTLPSPTAAQLKAQIATAVADANCTQSSDLAGITFAVQANYEQQYVSANQQALNAAVRKYKANYAKELSKLPALLQTASATLPTGPPGKHGAAGHRGKHSTPSPTRS
jgi:hypothetical protein